jgi:phenol 2-monooxygenase (NADPH)
MTRLKRDALVQFHLDGFQAGDPNLLPAAPGPDWRGRELPHEEDVLIAGCGPAGLGLAAQLARVPQIRTMIVETKAGPIEKGQADGLNVRSMEMFQAFGVGEALVRESHWINETTFWNPDPANPAQIRRVGRVQDVADGLSEMPHVLNNQALIHDMFLKIMREAPTRLVPDYGLQAVGVTVDHHNENYPLAVELEHTGPSPERKSSLFRARYVVGCDGARSTIRQSIGGKLHGDSAHQAWGVMDVLAPTDFPDYRMKAIIKSQHDGTVFILPREGGYLVRFYVEMDFLAEGARASQQGFTAEDTIAKAKRILHPFALDVKEVVWWSIYDIGHRLTDTFDDVPAGERGRRAPRVMLAGDACHTHSPKAGQGMNVSMGDTFNLGWKLISVLTGRASPELLHGYSRERRAAAKALVDFDHQWARVVGGRAIEDDGAIPRFQHQFIANGDFTAGLTVKYEQSKLVGPATWQELAIGFPIGMRFHSVPVIRLADAKPMHLGHCIEADNRWRIFAFAGAGDDGGAGGSIFRLCDYLENAEVSPIRRHTRAVADIDSVIDLRAIFQQNFREIEHAAMPSLLRSAKGKYRLNDYEKVFCADVRSGKDIFTMRDINRESGCLVIVRPDQNVAHLLPLDAFEDVSQFFDGFILRAQQSL